MKALPRAIPAIIVIGLTMTVLGLAPHHHRQDSPAQPAQQPSATPPVPKPTPPQPGEDTPADPALENHNPPPTESLPVGMPSDLAARLTALSPAAPDAYLRLGEEVAAAAIDTRGRELARHLLVLAYTLDRARAPGVTAPTATSACLALASLASTETDKRWLLALARAQDRRLAFPPWIARAEEHVDSGTAYLAATFVGLVRGGDALRAQRVIAQPGVRELIHRYERLLSPVGDTGGLGSLERELSRWPCPECGGKRVVKRFQSNPPQYRLCAVCNGTLGPEIVPAELAAQLRFESRLLSGTARSWAAQVVSDRGAPLRDVDPDELAPAFGVKTTQVLWRRGQWTAPDSQPLPASPAPTTAPPPSP